MKSAHPPVQTERWRTSLEVSAYVAALAGLIASVVAIIQGMTNIQLARSVQISAEVVRIYAREEASGRGPAGSGGRIRHYIDIRYIDPDGAPGSADGLPVGAKLARELEELTLVTGRQPTVRVAYTPDGGGFLARLVRRIRGPLTLLEGGYWEAQFAYWHPVARIAGPLLLFGGTGYIALHTRRVRALRRKMQKKAVG